jgi:GDP-L-fucose synthase
MKIGRSHLTFDKSSRIFLAGHAGMVGSAILRRLKASGCTNIITRTHRELDLTNQHKVENLFKTEKPEYVFVASAKAGGIMANISYPAEFIYQNLMIGTNIINFSFKYKTRKLLYLGAACMYPRLSPQPINEDCLLAGQIEPTNEPYAIAKIAGVKQCESYNRQYGTNFISVVPTNTYGPKDHFDEESHVIPSLIRKFHEAAVSGKKTVVVWGSGKPRREFIFVDDLADACFFLMKNYNDNRIINVGSGCDVSIEELAKIIQNVTSYKGRVIFDRSKPDGMPKKLLDSRRLVKLGWKATTNLRDGIEKTYNWYLSNYCS